jgi:hypothetical protein
MGRACNGSAGNNGLGRTPFRSACRPRVVSAARVCAAALSAVMLCAITLLAQAPASGSVRPAAPARAGTPAANLAAFSAVSCPRATFCIAVGARHLPHGLGTLAEQWNGHSWHVQSMPAVAAPEAQLSAVSCAATSNCTAVGFASLSPSNMKPLAEHWNGHSWRITQLANLPGTMEGYLAGVSCPRANDCVAVGWQQTSLLLTLAEHWNGHSWRLQHGAKLTRSALFAGVHCTGSFCMAVGQVENAAKTLVTMAERWNGHGWKLTSAVSPPGVNFSELLTVWCQSASDCLADGQYQGAKDSAIAEIWNGSRWKLQSLSAINDILYGIACSSLVRCMAVGAGLTRPVSQQWNGSSWHAVPTAHLPGALFADLAQVACPTATRCIAVGRESNGSPVDLGVTLAEEWNGSSWKVLHTVNP